MKHDNANDNLRVYSEKETHAAGIELRVWWMPQVPMPPFVYPVPTLQAAKMLCEALAQYDLFQLENKVKPDYSNAGGASWRHAELTGGEWHDFDPEDEGDCEEVEAAIAKAPGQVKASQIGIIGVDAGLCWIGDPCYILHPDEKPKSIGSDWSDFCMKLGSDFPTCKEFDYDVGHPGLGVVVSTGYGDGVYPVYAEIEDRVVTKVWVDFLNDDDSE